MNFKKWLLTVVMAALAVVLVACGGDDKKEDKEGATGGDEGDKPAAEELEGSVVIDGSGTVFPLMSRVAEEYMLNEQEGVSVEVSRAGTSAGFK
ncbi:MAG TPA: phosphate ABC transporter phosphate-binding protein, partial [Savagea sp.]